MDDGAGRRRRGRAHQKNRRPANQEAGAPAAGRLRRNADCAEHISGNMNQKSN